MTFLLRLFLLAAGLLLAASVAVAATVMLVFWAIRNAWARLIGKPGSPFIVRATARGGLERMHSRRGRPAPDISDVEPRMPAK